MRTTVPLVIDMSDDQVQQWAENRGLPRTGGRVMTRDVVADIHRYVLATVQGSSLNGHATITIKR